MPPNRKSRKLRVLFGTRVRDLRLGANLTQEELAERAGISVDFLSLIERGRNSPSFEKLQTIADALGLTVADLFSFKEGKA